MFDSSIEYNTLKRTETDAEVWWWDGAEKKAGWNIYRAEYQAYQKRKRYAADWNGSIDAVRECPIDKGGVSENRKRNTAHTGITA